MKNLNDNTKLLIAIQEAKELYLMGAVTLNELVLQCAILGVERTQSIFKSGIKEDNV